MPKATIQHRQSRQFNNQHSQLNIAHSASPAIHRHIDTSEVVACVYGSAIERFYDEQGNETEKVVMKVGSGISGVWIEQRQYHSLEAKGEMGLCLMRKHIDTSPSQRYRRNNK